MPRQNQKEKIRTGQGWASIKGNEFASRILPHEPEAVLHPCRYRGPAAGRSIAVAHARLAARRYYATGWLAGVRYRPPAFLSSAPYEKNAVGRKQRAFICSHVPL
jgi:hypothetical protein